MSRLFECFRTKKYAEDPYLPKTCNDERSKHEDKHTDSDNRAGLAGRRRCVVTVVIVVAVRPHAYRLPSEKRDIT